MIYFISIIICYISLLALQIVIFINALRTKSIKSWKALFILEVSSIFSIIFGIFNLASIVISIFAFCIFILFLLISIIVRIIQNKKIKNAVNIDSSKFLKKSFMILIIILSILLIVNICIIEYNELVEKQSIENSHLIVRVAFTGWENMFHSDYEYYAIGDNYANKVDTEKVNNYFNEDFESFDIYENTDNIYYFVQLKYSPEYKYPFQDNKEYMNIPLSDKYRLFYDDWTNDGNVPTYKDKNVMRTVAMKLYDGNLDNWTSKSGNTLGLVSFMLIKSNKYENKYLVENNDTELYVFEDGNLTKIMNVPEDGHFDYYYFI